MCDGIDVKKEIRFVFIDMFGKKSTEETTLKNQCENIQLKKQH
jgi:hypothetical protein